MWYFHVISPKRGYIKPIISSEDERPCKENNPITFPVQLHGLYPSAMRTCLTSPALIRPQPFSYSDAHEICSSHLVNRIDYKQYEQNVPTFLQLTALFYWMFLFLFIRKTVIVLSLSIPSNQDCELMNSWNWNCVQHVTKYLNHPKLATQYYLKSSILTTFVTSHEGLEEFP